MEQATHAGYEFGLELPRVGRLCCPCVFEAYPQAAPRAAFPSLGTQYGGSSAVALRMPTETCSP
jgi:hypothetical protein